MKAEALEGIDDEHASLEDAFGALNSTRRRSLKMRLLFWQYARLPLMGICAIVAAVLVYQGLRLVGMPEWLFEIANPVLSMGAIICGIIFGMTFTQKREHETIVQIYEESPFDLPPPPPASEEPGKSSFPF